MKTSLGLLVTLLWVAITQGCSNGVGACAGSSCGHHDSGLVHADSRTNRDGPAREQSQGRDARVDGAARDGSRDRGLDSSSDTTAADRDGPTPKPDLDMALRFDVTADTFEPEGRGRFEDHFERPELAAEAHGWRPPISEDPTLRWSIANGWLRVEGELGQPGSTALTTSRLVSDQRVEVTIKRSELKRAHFTDIILRMDPQLLAARFYRVRIYQEHKGFPNDPGKPDDPSDPDFGFAGVQVAIFKISAEGDGESGMVINDPKQQPPTRDAVDCIECPYVGGVPPDIDLRVSVKLVAATFDVTVARADRPTQPLLSERASDLTSDPIMAPGYTGLAHYQGSAEFDDFLLEPIAP